MNNLQTITTTYSKQTNPVRATAQKAYMRNQFEFLGLTSPERRLIDRTLIPQLTIDTEEKLSELALQLFALPEREYHHLACALLEKKKKMLTPMIVPTLEKMIRTHSWWDTIDWIAPRIVGPLITAHPELGTVMDEWIHSDYMWLRRSALLYQLKYKEHTDHEKLFSYITTCCHESEFFIRKAIGWVLREYSKTNRDAVAAFIEQHKQRLSPLSVREGSKYL